MKKIFLTLLIVFLSFTSCKKEETTPEVTTDTKETSIEENTVTLDSAAVAQAWEAYMTPSKAHEMLAKDNGTWDAELTFWSPDNPEEMKSTAVVTYKMIMGGRYQEGVYSGDMWGMPFEGKSTVGYDNTTEEFISTWIDNMGTGMMVTRGKYDETTKTSTLYGEMVDPVIKKAKKVKEVITFIDDNNQKMEMFDIAEDGKEFKSMQVVSKRKM
jgi:hypothetical protein